MSVECRVAVVGASKVGKSSLINAFQGEIRTGSRTVRSVGGRMVAFRVVEAQSNQFEVETIDNVDVLLLCFSVAAPLSALPRHRPRTHQPLVLVGCKADLRRKPRLGEAQPLVAARQALALCRHLGAVMYVETEAGAPPSVLAAFEVAALAHLGHFPPARPPRATSPLLGPESRASSVPRLAVSSTDMPLSTSVGTDEFWERFKSPVLRRKTALQRLSSLGSLGNISLAGSTRELGNLRQNRQRQERRGSIEPLVTIKCQRLNSDRRREEVDISVPLAVYKNLDTGHAPGDKSGQSRARTSWQHLRRLVRV